MRAIYTNGTSEKADILKIIQTLMEKGRFVLFFTIRVGESIL
jgi:hypothetical protein